MNYSFADAVRQLVAGKACKRPSWRGYVKREDVGTEGAHKIIFVKPDGTTTYTYNVSAEGVITTTDTLTLDVDLFAGMIANDWQVGNVYDCEISRSGSGSW